MLNDIYINGHNTKEVCNDNRAFNYGESLFTTCRVKNKKIVFFKDHTDRLLSSINRYFFYNTLTVTELESLKERINGELNNILRSYDNHQMRITCYLKAPLGLKTTTRHVSDIIIKVSVIPFKKRSSIKHIGFCNLQNKSMDDLFQGIKVPRYFERAYYLNHPDYSQFEDLLFMRKGHVDSMSVYNIFGVKNNTIYTPCLESCSVEGILRRKIIKTAKENGLNIKECLLLKSDMEEMESLFAVNSVQGILNINMINKRNLQIENHIIEKLKLYIKEMQ